MKPTYKENKKVLKKKWGIKKFKRLDDYMKEYLQFTWKDEWKKQYNNWISIQAVGYVIGEDGKKQH